MARYRRLLSTPFLVSFHSARLGVYLGFFFFADLSSAFGLHLQGRRPYVFEVVKL